MKLWSAILVLAGGILATMSALAYVRRPRQVVVLGDSLVASGALCLELESLLPRGSSVNCKGYPGQGVQIIGSHLGSSITSKTTDIVILAGVNDLASGRSVTSTLEWLESMYTEATSLGVRVVAVCVLPWRGHALGALNYERTEQLNNRIKDSFGPNVVVDTDSLGISGYLSGQYDAGDGLHLNKKGQEALGHLIYRKAF